MAIGTTAAIVGGTLAAATVGSSIVQSRAADKQADKQAAATREAQQAQIEAGQEIREDLRPFKEAGLKGLEQLQGLVTDPQEQIRFINENPFIQSLAQRSTETLLQNQAAQGRVGTGDTAEALQKSLVLLGSDLLNQRITQSQNLAGLGQSAAAQQAQQSQVTAGNVGNLALQRGNIAAKEIGAANTQAFQSGVSGLSNLASNFLNL